MPPTTIHCVRHAQGYHNISVANHAIHDPMLTPLGEEQCNTLQKVFPFMSQVDYVVASPLKRTMYTALLSFEPAIKDKKLRVVALPELQETSDLPCDTGSNVQEVEREFKGKPVDLSMLYTPRAKDWTSKSSRWAPNAAAIDARAQEAREWFYNCPEKEIVVVTHGGFLHYFTEDWRDTHKMDGTPSAGKSHRYSPPASHPEAINTQMPKTRRTRPATEVIGIVSTKPARPVDGVIGPFSTKASRTRTQSETATTSSRPLHHSHIDKRNAPLPSSVTRSGKPQHHHHHKHSSSSSPSSHEHKRKHHHRSHWLAGTGWANAEYRSYTFDQSKSRASLIETPESRKRRAGDEKPLSKEEKSNLQRVRTKDIAEQDKQDKASYQKAANIQAKWKQIRADRDLGGYSYGFC